MQTRPVAPFDVCCRILSRLRFEDMLSWPRVASREECVVSNTLRSAFPDELPNAPCRNSWIAIPYQPTTHPVVTYVASRRDEWTEAAYKQLNSSMKDYFYTDECVSELRQHSNEQDRSLQQPKRCITSDMRQRSRAIRPLTHSDLKIAA